VLDAYGWPHDISNEEILARLLEENLKREPVGSGWETDVADGDEAKEEPRKGKGKTRKKKG